MSYLNYSLSIKLKEKPDVNLFGLPVADCILYYDDDDDADEEEEEEEDSSSSSSFPCSFAWQSNKIADF